MNFRSMNYYGVSKETYRDCLDQIKATNRFHIGIITAWFILNCAIFTISSLMNWLGVDRRSTRMYAIFLGIGALFEVLIFALPKLFVRYSRIWAYLSMATLYAYGIRTSASKPYESASIFLVILVLCSLSYIDVFWRMVVFTLASGAGFLLSSHAVKPKSIYFQDVYNYSIVLLLSLILHYSFQRTRMRQFETFHRNLQISRQLEVSSSFDALTSLLNRGRFFSLAGKILAGLGKNEYIAVCLLDLDGFKKINDTLGHQMGDKVIQIAASTILETVGIDLSEKWSYTERAVSNGFSLAGRLGGDEFIVMIRGEKDKTAVISLLQNVLISLNSVRTDGLNGIHASFGVTEVLPTDKNMDAVYNRADDALYQSKRAGKNKITFFETMPNYTHNKN